MVEQEQPQHRPRKMESFSRPSVDNMQSPILHPTVPNNNLAIKMGITSTLKNAAQFHGSMSDEAHAHINSFYDLTNIKTNGVS
ncbi:unnamed protein product [Linum trigynum]|uniref:Uncharacterized protein n=1 Tax=Linum trigynum TaxID=586398 RepID=A0AAV2GST2_9ROSI